MQNFRDNGLAVGRQIHRVIHRNSLPCDGYLRVIPIHHLRAAAIEQTAIVFEQGNVITFLQRECDACGNGYAHVRLAVELRRLPAVDGQHRFIRGGVGGQDEVEVLEVIDAAHRQPLAFYGKRVAGGEIAAAVAAVKLDAGCALEIRAQRNGVVGRIAIAA